MCQDRNPSIDWEYTVFNYVKVKVKFSWACHESIWESGGTAQCILKLTAKWR
jgi:hypothetical protein